IVSMDFERVLLTREVQIRLTAKRREDQAPQCTRLLELAARRGPERMMPDHDLPACLRVRQRRSSQRTMLRSASFCGAAQGSSFSNFVDGASAAASASTALYIVVPASRTCVSIAKISTAPRPAGGTMR